MLVDSEYPITELHPIALVWDRISFLTSCHQASRVSGSSEGVITSMIIHSGSSEGVITSMIIHSVSGSSEGVITSMIIHSVSGSSEGVITSLYIYCSDYMSPACLRGQYC